MSHSGCLQFCTLLQAESKLAEELHDPFLWQDGSGTISTKELLPVLRSIGQNPTEDEILNLVGVIDG